MSRDLLLSSVGYGTQRGCDAALTSISEFVALRGYPAIQVLCRPSNSEPMNRYLVEQTQE